MELRRPARRQTSSSLRKRSGHSKSSGLAPSGLVERLARVDEGAVAIGERPEHARNKVGRGFRLAAGRAIRLHIVTKRPRRRAMTASACRTRPRPSYVTSTLGMRSCWSWRSGNGRPDRSHHASRSLSSTTISPAGPRTGPIHRDFRHPRCIAAGKRLAGEGDEDHDHRISAPLAVLRPAETIAIPSPRRASLTGPHRSA